MHIESARRLLAVLACGMVLAGQTAAPTAPKPATRSAPKATSDVDNVIQLVKSGMSEGLIIKTLQKQNKPMNLKPEDLVKLQKAGVSENIIGVMMDPTSAPAAAAPARAPDPPPAAAPEPVASAPAPMPVATPAAPSQADKKRVIIDAFDYSAVKSQVQAIFNTQVDIGKGIRSMLVKRIAEANLMVIVERDKIKMIEDEQNRNVGNRVKQGTGARVGRIRGADAILAGDIIIFGRDDKHTKVKGGGFGGAVIGGIASSHDENKAVVAIDFRLIDAETSEVIATGEARGESVRKSKGLGGLGGVFGKAAGGMEVDMTSSNFAETIIGEATMDCVNKLAEQMNKQVPGLQKKAVEVEAYVADVSGPSMVISAGGNDGVAVGDVFEVLRVVREVKDPVTKEVLDRVTDKLGEFKVATVRDKIATGTYTGNPSKVGDVVRKKL